MIDFLAKFSGKNNNHNMEKEELKNLRKEVARLKNIQMQEIADKLKIQRQTLTKKLKTM